MSSPQYRTLFHSGKLETREEGGGRAIEAYFAVFNQRTELIPGYYEEIAPGAFAQSLNSGDIRCLFNHDSGLVLGRTASGTLQLQEDAHGLWGRVLINENDKQAMDIYARVARGDISGCSFGFNPKREEYRDVENGILARLLEADTIEVSVCAFPAYEGTQAQARSIQEARKRTLEQKRASLKSRLLFRNEEDKKC